MHTNEKSQSIDTLCALFGRSRQAFYKGIKRRSQEIYDQELIVQMVQKKRKLMPRIGGRKLYSMLKPDIPQNISVGRDKFFSILRENQLLVKRKRYRAITTMSNHWLRKYPNLVKEMIPEAPNQLWVSDITYIQTKAGFVYLFLITDAYSRKILGWKTADTLESKHAIKALEMALSRLPATVEGLIHHSDRGVQYCSYKYVDKLKKHGIKVSMTENGDPRENAIAERINGILKSEWLNDMEFESLQEAHAAVRQVIQIYNQERPHSSIEMLTPQQAHNQTGQLNRLWKNYYKKPQDLCSNQL
jgi:transposase InsO family protein